MINDRPFSNRRGFTLVEVLLGLLMLSFVSLCVYGTFWTGMMLSRRLDRQKTVFRQSQLVLNRFARDVGKAVAYDFSGSYPDKVAFDGRNDSLVFIQRDHGALKAVRYYLETPGQGLVKKTILGEHYKKNVSVTQSSQTAIADLALVREEASFAEFLAGGFPSDSVKELMVARIAPDTLKLDYARSISNGSGLSWSTEWNNSSLPAVVRLSFGVLDYSENGPQTVSFDKSALIPISVSQAGQ
ncbi:MAG: prepilin-type N-terminal cleavage/methylation domain-containing protein [Candidatus Omnitrophica bacterium]|nr:prepilin-type N-terminal cleavage/methylation domain-containing protein [Candidatus Omnitrophota bacterium]